MTSSRPPTLTPRQAIKTLNGLAERGGDVHDDDLSIVSESCHLWFSEVRWALERAFGKDGPEFRDFQNFESYISEEELYAGSEKDKRLVRRRYLDDACCRVESYMKLLSVLAEDDVPVVRPPGHLIFIGHGRSHAWRDLKDFLKERVQLPVDEFNRMSVAGTTTVERLNEMLDSARLAFLVMTAEDEESEGKARARQNVVHEVGLFQGRLGFKKAIVLLEEGCEEFSNIAGLSQIRFPKGNVAATFEEVRRVLEREGLLPGTGAAF